MHLLRWRVHRQNLIIEKFKNRVYGYIIPRFLALQSKESSWGYKTVLKTSVSEGKSGLYRKSRTWLALLDKIRYQFAKTADL